MDNPTSIPERRRRFCYDGTWSPSCGHLLCTTALTCTELREKAPGTGKMLDSLPREGVLTELCSVEYSEIARSTEDRVPWFDSYNGLTWAWISLTTKYESPCQAPLDQGVNWYTEMAMSVQVWYSWAPYVGCTQYRELNSLHRETQTLICWCDLYFKTGSPGYL